MVKPIRSEGENIVLKGVDTIVDKQAYIILLVEDNIVNQRVASSMMLKLGYSVDIADNGRIALDKVHKQRYDLIFMDCQMPVLDGFAATHQIRRMEKKQSAHPVPIIAMTANAMEGDREQCLEVGMNDYLSKPVRINTLKTCIEKWISSSQGRKKPGQTPLETELPVSSLVTPHLDEHIASDIVECLGRDAFDDIADLFIKTGADLVGTLNSAMENHDREQLHYVAHTLKGSSGNIGASVLFDLCDLLDSEVKASAEFDAMKNFVEQINQEFDYLVGNIKKVS
jgi:CheY-like chemotaxis protein